MTKSEENFKIIIKKEKNTFYKTIDVHCTHNVFIIFTGIFFILI